MISNRYRPIALGLSMLQSNFPIAKFLPLLHNNENTNEWNIFILLKIRETVSI